MATENNTPYVFISYAHADNCAVLPAIRAMQHNGIHLWYDSGIEAGSEWPEYIAEKVMNCQKFVLFISKSYLESQNCKRELNFAISRKKDILSVFLEEVQLSPGMEMQLGTYQAIFRNRFAEERIFVESLARERFFEACKEQPANDAQPKEAAVKAAPQQTVAQAKPEPSISLESIAADVVGTRPAQSKAAQPQEKQLPKKSKNVAAALAILLGSFGLHKFYLGKTLAGVLYLVFFWTYVPTIIGFIEGIMYLMKSDKEFETKYQCRLK